MLFGGMLAGQACAVERVLQSGDLLAIATTGVEQVMRIDLNTGARTRLFSFRELGESNAVVFQKDYAAVTPQGRVLLQGRSYGTPLGPYELYELTLESMSLRRVSRIFEQRQDPSASPALYNLLDDSDDARRIAIEPDGRVLVLSSFGGGVFRFDPITGDSSMIRGSTAATALPQNLTDLLVTPSGSIVALGGLGVWELGDSDSDRSLGGPLGAMPVVTADDRIVSFFAQESREGDFGFAALDLTTGLRESLGGFGDFLPTQTPPITAENIAMTDFVLRDQTLWFAGRGELWRKPIGGGNSLRLANPVALPDPSIDRLMLVPTLILPGDFNNDDVVDAADFTVWRDHLGTSHPLAGAGDEEGASRGVVDLADYQLWRQAFGDTRVAPDPQPTPGLPAPEPTRLAFVCLAYALVSPRLVRTQTQHVPSIQ